MQGISVPLLVLVSGNCFHQGHQLTLHGLILDLAISFRKSTLLEIQNISGALRFAAFVAAVEQNTLFGYPDAYGYYDDEDDGGCYLVRRRVMTRYGWRIRRVQVSV